MRTVIWERVDIAGLEYAEIELDPLRLSGEVVLTEGGKPSALSYEVECDAAGATRRARVCLKHEGKVRQRVVERDSQGRWRLDGRRQPELQGLWDIDLSVTPSTNTPPIRRLELRVGQEASVTAAWMRFPTMKLEPLRQIYRRVGARLYAYEAPQLGYRARIGVDRFGVVERYGRLWKRLR